MIHEKNKKVALIFLFVLYSCNSQKKDSTTNSSAVTHDKADSFTESTRDNTYDQYKGKIKSLATTASVKPDQAGASKKAPASNDQWIQSALETPDSLPTKVVSKTNHFFVCSGKITYFYTKDKVDEQYPSSFFSLEMGLQGFWFVNKAAGLLEVYAQDRAGSLVVLSQKSTEESWSTQVATGYQRKDGNFVVYNDENQNPIFLFEIEQKKWFGLAKDKPKYEKVKVENGKAELLVEEKKEKEVVAAVKAVKKEEPATEAPKEEGLHLLEGHEMAAAPEAEAPDTIKFKELKESQDVFQKSLVHTLTPKDKDKFFHDFFSSPKDYIWDPASSQQGNGSIVDALITTSCP